MIWKLEGTQWRAVYASGTATWALYCGHDYHGPFDTFEEIIKHIESLREGVKDG